MPDAASPVPGLTKLDHIGVTVPDLAEARHFFERVLGCEYLYSMGPMLPKGHWMSEHLGVADDTVLRELHFFRLGGQAVFEVFEYVAAEQRLDPPLNSDIGGHHVALYVDDLDAAVASLRGHGMRVMGEPTTSKSHHVGQRWIYFLSPWGMQFELVSYPNGRAFYLAEAVRTSAEV